jgi:hypothetical protein
MNPLINGNFYNVSKFQDSIDVKRTIHGKLLKLPATIFDIVEAVDITAMSDVVSSVEGNFLSILNFCEDIDLTYFNSQDRVEALWRIMISNLSTSETDVLYPASNDVGESFQA